MTRVSPITLPRRKTIFSSLDKLEKKYKKNQNQQSVDFLLIFSSSIFKFHFLVQHFLRAARGECAALVTDRWWVKSVIFFRTAWRRGKHRLSLSFKVGSNQKQQKKNQVMKARGTTPPFRGLHFHNYYHIFQHNIFLSAHKGPSTYSSCNTTPQHRPRGCQPIGQLPNSAYQMHCWTHNRQGQRDGGGGAGERERALIKQLGSQWHGERNQRWKETQPLFFSDCWRSSSSGLRSERLQDPDLCGSAAAFNHSQVEEHRSAR